MCALCIISERTSVKAVDPIIGIRRQELSEPPFPQFSFLPVWIPSFPGALLLLVSAAISEESYGAPAPALSSFWLHVQCPALSIAPASLCPEERNGMSTEAVFLLAEER